MTQQDVITEDFILQTKQLAVQPLSPLKDAKDAFEKDYVSHVLSLCEGNVSKAAKLAGKYRADFYNLLKKHEIDVSRFKKSDNDDDRR